MAAFERIQSGIRAMDAALDNIRLGDNVVWQVSSLDEFRLFARPFAEQAIRDGRNLLYIRFAEHDPILPEMEGLRIVHVPLSHRFETFTVEIHNIIEKEGYDAFYVFDCLSELEAAWATDLLMGDFFHLTCPFLFILDTVAYFPVLRGRHSNDAVSKIRNTTQLFLDVFTEEKEENQIRSMYVRPLKVWERSSETMFRPHLYDLRAGTFLPETESVHRSHLYRQMNLTGANINQSMDSWERFFQSARVKYESGLDITQECSRMCNIMLTRDERLRVLIKEHFRPEDYFEVHDRMVGTGMIGGKATGMLLARKLTENLRPDIYERIEPHDSFYIGSDVFYTYIVDNGLWDLRVRQRTEEGYFTLAAEVEERLLQGVFSNAMEEEFRRLLEYYGDDPVIVRSSSILEDGFGNAFAGKYESVFCAGTGSLEERLETFEQAIRTVYASTMGLSALDYRKRRGLDKRDEQMAILVQRVSGSRYKDFYMPCAAGVGYSVSPYRFSPEHPSEGMLRLVMGLGTAAVDRRTGSYPRMVMMEDPTKVTLTSSADKHQFSQRLVDAVSFASGEVEGLDPDFVRREIPAYMTRLLLSHDWDAERMFTDRGENRQIFYVSCDGLVKNRQLMDDMRGILKLLKEAYVYPVDIEYTINVAPSGDYVIDLLQCRPLQQSKEGDAVIVPQAPADRILLETKGVSMGFSRTYPVDLVVYIDPILYYEMPYRDKFRVRDLLSAINWKLRGQGKRMLLLTPGRICTSSAELGVPSAFADISEFDMIAEISETRAGYVPELSYGSHIFQDLVEAEILYTAVFETQTTLHFTPSLLEPFAVPMTDYAGKTAYAGNTGGLEGILQVYDTGMSGLTLYYDMSQEHLQISFRSENE
ncbi:MAG: PEP/pyruvate-binding domain-containing protein [Sarcina sp.]|nr:PEP/pyruvate-binding domain-containing protein [Sarcina sp.]